MKPRLFRICIIFLTLAMVSVACGLFNGSEELLVTPTHLPEAQPEEPADRPIEPAEDSDAQPDPSDAKPESPDSQPESDIPLGDEYRSLEGGYAFHPLQDYSLDEFFGFTTMISPDGNPDSGPAIVMIGEEIDEELTLDELYDTQMEEISSEDVEFSIPRDVMIGGKPGRSVDLSGSADDDVDVVGKMTLVLASPTQTWMLLSVAPVDQWDDFSILVEAVETTITFFEPQIEIGEPVAPDPSDESLGDEFTSSDGGYSFRLVEGFEIDEIYGNTSMTAPDSHPDAGPMIAMVGESLDQETTLDELYNWQISQVSSSDEVMELSAPRDDAVGDALGRTVDISGITDDGVDVAGQLTIVLVNPKQMFMIGALAPADQWNEFAAVYEAVKLSVSFVRPTGDEIRQWAEFAFASSSYGDPDWHAVRATGAPDVPLGECVDHQNAWASESPDSVEWLELFYATPVIPTEINIIQTHSPDQVVKVELIDTLDSYREIYSGVPENLWDECPYTLSIPVDVDYGVIGLKITIDQSVVPTTWNEIDAVELVGVELEEDAVAPPKEDDPPATSSGEISLQDPPVPSHEAGQISERLLALGYEICTPSDFFNPQTEKVVKTFQELNNLSVDGIVGQETWERLFSADATPAEPYDPDLIFSEPLEGVHGDKIVSSGMKLWVLTRNHNFLEAYDTNTGELAGLYSVSTLPGEEDYTIQAMAYDGTKMWIASQGESDAILQAYDLSVDPEDGILTPYFVESIYLDDVIYIRGLSHDGLRLWVSYESSAFPAGLAEINPRLGQVSNVIKFGLDEYASAPAFDGEQLWVAFEGRIGGYAIRPMEPFSGTTGDPLGICGYQVAYDGNALYVVKEYGLWIVDPYSGEVYGAAEFDSRIKDITFSGARIYLLFGDDSVRFYQVY